MQRKISLTAEPIWFFYKVNLFVCLCQSYNYLGEGSNTLQIEIAPRKPKQYRGDLIFVNLCLLYLKHANLKLIFLPFQYISIITLLSKLGWGENQLCGSPNLPHAPQNISQNPKQAWHVSRANMKISSKQQKF